MEEKKAKEDQGVRDAGQVFWVPGQTSLPRQGTSGTPAKFSGYPAKLPCPGRGRQGRRPSFPGTLCTYGAV